MLRMRRERRTPEEMRGAALASIRETFAWFGVPLDHITDEEIETGTVAMTRIVSTMGVTTAQAAQALSSALRVLHT